MKEGKISVNMKNALIQGEAGVGKTSTKHILFDKPPPKVRTSTPLAEAPVHIRVDNSTTQSSWPQAKNVSDVKVQSFGTSWRACSDSQLQEIVTDAVAAISNKRLPGGSPLDSDLSNTVIADDSVDARDEFMQIAKQSMHNERKNVSVQEKDPFSHDSAHSTTEVQPQGSLPERDDFTEIAQKSVYREIKPNKGLPGDDPQKNYLSNTVVADDSVDEFMQIAKLSVHNERENISVQMKHSFSHNIANSKIEVQPRGSTVICQAISESDDFAEIAQKSVYGERIETIRDKKSTPASSEIAPNTSSHSRDISDKVSDTNAFQTAFASIHNRIVYLSDKKKSESIESSTNIFGTNWIYFIDSGGQPHFHNLLPHFVHGISVALFVHRLSGRLEDYPIVEYFDNDQSVSVPYKSSISTEDTLKCLVRSMQSHTVDDQKPKLVFIGTFLDEIRKSSETLSEKNKKLLKLLTPEFVDQLVFCTDLDQLIFPVNAKNPSDHEKRISAKIRQAVESSPSRKVDVPIWWHVLEISLKELSSVLDRMVFSKQECLEVAHQLKISDDALIEALKFFHHQHIFHYYPDILPNVVFSSPQVLLDKLTELVKDAYVMRVNPSSSSEHAHESLSGSWLKFRNRGIITLEFLSHFKQHYRFEDNLFTPPDLLKIFMRHLILTPLSTPEFHHVVDFNSPSIEYYMPSLLDMLSLAELECHRTFNSAAYPLLVRFPNGWPRAGVFCCLQVYLIQQLNWELVLGDATGKPKLIAQNCVMISPPDSTCIVTLIDSFSYFEVHVQAKPHICKSICPVILNYILKGINASCRTLRYNNDRPHIAFFCSCDLTPTSSASASGTASGPPQRHAAKVFKKEGSLRCTIDGTTTHEAEDRHTIWLHECR